MLLCVNELRIEHQIGNLLLPNNRVDLLLIDEPTSTPLLLIHLHLLLLGAVPVVILCHLQDTATVLPVLLELAFVVAHATAISTRVRPPITEESAETIAHVVAPPPNIPLLVILVEVLTVPMALVLLPVTNVEALIVVVALA